MDKMEIELGRYYILDSELNAKVKEVLAEANENSRLLEALKVVGSPQTEQTEISNSVSGNLRNLGRRGGGSRSSGGRRGGRSSSSSRSGGRSSGYSSGYGSKTYGNYGTKVGSSIKTGGSRGSSSKPKI